MDGIPSLDEWTAQIDQEAADWEPDEPIAVYPWDDQRYLDSEDEYVGKHRA